MGETDALSSLERLLWRLMKDASDAIDADPISQIALERAMEYRVLTEMVITFGSMIAELSDIEEHELSTGRDKARIS